MLKIYNTLSQKKETFKPRKDKQVNLFVCGPTVYDFSHIGHARTYIVFDMIVKHLRAQGFKVFYLQNITDIDDKIIARAKEENTSPQKLAKKFEKEYFKDMETLGVDSISQYARATEHIKQIIGQVKKLLQKEYAYKAKDGIYYDISKFKDYGKLSQRTTLQAEDAVSRIDRCEQKKNKGDFCLWKFSKKGEPKWDSPWGKGRPGWHIEDTAICEKYFGYQYDIHGGARDLIFPHHEAEIAQMEALSNKTPMVKYWIHSGFLTVKGKKMSKSLGNFITIRDFLKDHSPRTLRFFVLKSHYRSPINYTPRGINQTQKEMERIDEFLEKLLEIEKSPKKTKKNTPKSLISRAQKGYSKAMNHDFNTPKALAEVSNLMTKSNSLIDQKKLGSRGAKKILQFLSKIDKTFNFLFPQKPKPEIPQNILDLADQREKYRNQKQWNKADKIRKKIQNLGYKIKDTPQGPKIKKVK